MHFKFLLNSKLLLRNTYTNISKLSKQIKEGNLRVFPLILLIMASNYFCPHILHQNGRRERKYKHFVDIGLTLLAQANLSMKFWWNAFHTFIFLINKLPVQH